jgi:hypothetical protein
LARLFLPWQQWTQDAPEIAALTSRFRQVLCLNGHVHGAGTRKPVASGQRSVISESNGLSGSFATENRQFTIENSLHLSLPATAWPLPAAVLGTPAVVRPGLGPHGCGWALVTLSAGEAYVQPYLWQT